MFVLYIALMRGFGFCGAVAPGIDFASDEFWAQWKAVDINAWVKRSGHRFTNTIHALASAIKKLQGFAAEEPSTRLYHGLGGLSVAFAVRALMSTTKQKGIALEYNGVHDDDDHFIVLTETKFSILPYTCSGSVLASPDKRQSTCDDALTMTLLVRW